MSGGRAASNYSRVGNRAPSQPVVADKETSSYRKGGITLPGRYYGEGATDKAPTKPNLEEDARALHPVNRRRFERQERSK